MASNIYESLLKEKQETKGDDFHNMMNATTNAASKEAEIIQGMPEEAGMFEGFSSDLKKMNGEKPLRGWQAALNAFYEGASAGKNKKKIAELNKIANGLAYVEQQGQKANEMLLEKRKMKEAEEAVVPSLKNYLETADSLSPRDRIDFLANVVKQYNSMTGGDFVIDSVDGVNPANITLSSKQAGVHNIDLFNTPLFKGLKDKIEKERLTKRAEQFALDQQKIEKDRLMIDQNRVNVYNKDIDNRWSPQANFDVNAGKTQGTEGNKMALKLQESNMELEDVSYDLFYLKDLLKNGQVVTGNTLRAKNERFWAEMKGDQALSDTELFDAVSKSMLKFSNNNASFGNANQKEFEFLKAPVPDSMKTKAATERLLDRFSDKLKKTMSRNEKFISQYENFNSHVNAQLPQPNSTETGAGTTIPDKPASGGQAGGKIPVNKIVNGKKIAGFMTKEQFNKADKNIFELR